jgi:hypothetical protein
LTRLRDRRAVNLRVQELAELDPATKILDLKIVDPAMGSGHFLVSLVDYLSDAVTTTMGEAHHAVEWTEYISPLDGRLSAIRNRIRAEAQTHGWLVRDDQIVNKNLIKRFVLKRCVYGVDKNPMAVELAKVALWLHTFTAGAPLSFLDHHLKCGDSLFGEWVRQALDDLAARGIIMISDAVRAAEAAIAGAHLVENLTDAEIAEVKASADTYREVGNKTEPLRRFLNFWHAIKWLELSEHETRALQALLDGIFGQPFPVAAGLSPPIAPAGYQNGEAGLFGLDAQQQLQWPGRVWLQCRTT